MKTSVRREKAHVTVFLFSDKSFGRFSEFPKSSAYVSGAKKIS